MKIHQPILVSALFFFAFACENNSSTNDLSLDCNQLITALASYDNELLKDEISKITFGLEPTVTADDPYGHKENFQKLLDELNNCTDLKAELSCYACIKTNPPQSEILFTIDSGYYKTYRTVDILTSKDSVLQLVRIHESEYQELKLNETNYLGCFQENQSTIQKTFSELNDTLYFEILSKLILRAEMSYNCCGLLSDSVLIEENNVNIYISDTCVSECLCNYICDFEFEYQFTDFGQKNIQFKVFRKGYNELEFKLWKQVSFIDGLD